MEVKSEVPNEEDFEPEQYKKLLKELAAKKMRQHVYGQIQNAQMEMREDLVKKNFVYIEGSFGRYHRIKLIHESRDVK